VTFQEPREIAVSAFEFAHDLNRRDHRSPLNEAQQFRQIEAPTIVADSAIT
jgi:hypothetical protein